MSWYRLQQWAYNKAWWKRPGNKRVKSKQQNSTFLILFRKKYFLNLVLDHWDPRVKEHIMNILDFIFIMTRQRAGSHLQQVIKRQQASFSLPTHLQRKRNLLFKILLTDIHSTSNSSMTQSHQVPEQFSLMSPVCQNSLCHIHEYLFTRLLHAKKNPQEIKASLVLAFSKYIHTYSI